MSTEPPSARYRTHTRIVEEMQWTGRNIRAVTQWFVGSADALPNDVTAKSLKDKLGARRGDWLVRDASGVVWPLRPYVFAHLFQPDERVNERAALAHPWLEFLEARRWAIEWLLGQGRAMSYAYVASTLSCDELQVRLIHMSTEDRKRERAAPDHHGILAKLEPSPGTYRVCPAGCGCRWKDNGDGTMSLFSAWDVPCSVCDPLPWDRLVESFEDERRRKASDKATEEMDK